MTQTETYNGWTNYETWNVALWLGNEEHSSRYWRSRTDEALRAARGDKDEATRTLARQLESKVEEAAPDLGASCYADLLNAALSAVDWREIARHYIDEAAE